jgi:uncharacterized OB-fold protein
LIGDAATGLASRKPARDQVHARRTQSPLNTYLAHLEKGELAYQFSPGAGKAVFYPRVLCPFTGSSKLEWRLSKGLGTVYATTVVHPGRGRALQRGADRLRRGLPPDEPRGGH